MEVSKIMKSSGFSVFLAVLFCYRSGICAEENKSCINPNGQLGECIIIRDCPSLYILTKKRPISTISQKHRDFLKKSHCGFSGDIPKVCCTNSSVLEEPKLDDDKLPPLSSVNHILPTSDVCGEDTQRRIWGGQNVTELDEFPWMALIKYESPNHYKRFLCGGVLISKRYVMTAAHCLKEKSPTKWKISSVTLGEYNKDSTEDCINNGFRRECLLTPPIDVPVEEAITHEKYDPHDNNKRHDIAILRLDRDITYTDYIKPICLPLLERERNKTYNGANLTVAGWGQTEKSYESSIKLKLIVPVKSNSECRKLYTYQNIQLNENQLCAGGIKDKNSCNGDSGGPLMTVSADEYGDPKWYAAGIVSFGPDPCGFEGWPAVYTRVSKYVGWILRHMKE